MAISFCVCTLKILVVKMTKTGIKIFFCVGIFLLYISPASANSNIMYTSAPNPVGSGARALGMGGAFIGIADDATAASWNPGGLVQLKRPELSIVGSFLKRDENMSAANESETINDSVISVYKLNYLSAAFPFSIMQRNMVIAINYQRLYDYTSESEYTIDFLTIKRDLTGNLSPIGLAYGIQIIPKIKFGITFNFWGDINGSNQLKETYKADGLLSVFSQKKHKFSGFNITTGLLLQPLEKLNIGVVFKSPFTANIKARTETVDTILDDPIENQSFQTNKKLKMPLSYGVGFQYKLTDKFKLATDVYQTNWNHYTYEDEENDKFSAVTGQPKGEANVDRTTQIRAGIEYLFIKPAKCQSYPFRMGIFYDPIPDSGSPVDAYGVSIGLGFSTKKFAIDGFYQYKFSDNNSSMILNEEYFPKKIKEHTVYMSLIYYL